MAEYHAEVHQRSREAIWCKPVRLIIAEISYFHATIAIDAIDAGIASVPKSMYSLISKPPIWAWYGRMTMTPVTWLTTSIYKSRQKLFWLSHIAGKIQSRAPKTKCINDFKRSIRCAAEHHVIAMVSSLREILLMASAPIPVGITTRKSAKGRQFSKFITINAGIPDVPSPSGSRIDFYILSIFISTEEAFSTIACRLPAASHAIGVSSYASTRSGIISRGRKHAIW